MGKAKKRQSFWMVKLLIAVMLNVSMLYFFGASPLHAAQRQQANTISITCAQNVFVQPGDTLSAISQKYNVSIEAIQQLNGIENSTIYVGQELNIPQEP